MFVRRCNVILLKQLPAVVFVHFILILHPRVSVHKELQKGEDGHESESYKRHWREEQSVHRHRGCSGFKLPGAEPSLRRPYLSPRWPTTPRSSQELSERRRTPSPESELSS